MYVYIHTHTDSHSVRKCVHVCPLSVCVCVCMGVYIYVQLFTALTIPEHKKPLDLVINRLTERRHSPPDILTRRPHSYVDVRLTLAVVTPTATLTIRGSLCSTTREDHQRDLEIYLV